MTVVLPFGRAGAHAWLLHLLGPFLGSGHASAERGGRGLRRFLLCGLAAFLPLLTLASGPARGAGDVIFSAIGDVPYAPEEIPELEQHVADHNLYSPSAFLVHLGDIQSSSEVCEEIRYQTVADILKSSEVPVFIVPGDNEWVNCADPAQGWAWWEQNLLGLEQSFCGIWPVESQAARPENFSFVRDEVLFIGLNHVSGTPSSVLQADADWVDAQFAAHGAPARAAVLMAQAAPDGVLMDAVLANGRAFAKPVLYIHGDGHEWLEDPLFFGEPNMLRVQVDRGSDSHPPVEVTVTAAGLFVFDRDPWPPGTPEVLRPPCDPPTANFSAAPVLGAAPLVVSFTDLSAGAPTSWLWSFGDGETSSEEDPTHTYADPGVYDVTLTVSNALGSSTKLLAGLVTVVPPPPGQTFLPTADAKVNSSSPSSNYGTTSDLRVKTDTTIYRSYLRFDLTGLESSAVLSAKLRLFTTGGSDDGGSLYPVASDWTESGITWATAPAIGGAPLAGPAPVVTNQWREINVGSVVRGNGSYAFALDSPSGDSAYYSSREGANPPQLVVQTDPWAAPVAEFGASPTQGTAPLAVAFTDLSTGGPTSWLWSFGDGATATEQNPSHGYASPGVYDVSLSVSNANGSDTLTRAAFVEVSAPVPPVADFVASPLAGEAPLAVAFTDLSAGSPTSWLWSFGDGGISTSQSPSHTYAAAGLYDVTLVATNAAGSDTRVRAGYVAVAEPPPRQTFVPAADARVSSGSPNGNYGDDDELRAKSGSTIVNSYLRFDLAGLAGLGVVSAKLRLFVTDASPSGGSVYRVGNAWSEDQITWSDAPAISGAPLASLGAVADGEWVEFDVTEAVGGDGSVSLAVASTSSNSVYYSSREGSNPPQLVVETGAAVAPTADFGGAPLQGPAPLMVAFDDFSTGGPMSWLWSFGDGATSTEQDPSHTYAAPGSYDVSLTVSNIEGSDTLMRAAFVAVSPPLPIATFLPAADAKVYSSKPDVNYGAEPNLRVKTSSKGTWRSFLRFDVAGLDAPVVRATLRLYVDDGSRNGGALHGVSAAWSEDAITWNTAPPLDAAPIASLGAVATAVWVELDVTSTVTGDGSYAFGLGGGSSNTAYYGSRESGNPPQLVIEMAE